MALEDVMNATNFGEFTLAVNYSTNQLLFVGIFFVLFIILCAALIIKDSSIWDAFTVAGIGTLPVAIIMYTLSYNGVPAIPLWLFIMSLFSAALGITGKVFTSN